MTFAELKYRIEILYESINSDDAPGFLDAEWEEIINIAQTDVITKILKQGLTKDASVRRILEPVTFPGTTSNLGTDSHFKNIDGTNSVSVDLADIESSTYQIWWILNENVSSATIDNIPVLPKTFDYYKENINNPFAKPDTEEGFWSLHMNDSVVIITDGTTVTAYNVVFVDHPNNYPVDTNDGYDYGALKVHESLHPDIVKRAEIIAHHAVLDPQGFQMALTDGML